MKSFLKLVILLVIVADQVALPASTFSNQITNSTNEEVQTFRETFALRMQSYMNVSANPCDDFYEYACGNFHNAIKERNTVYRRNNFFDITYILIDFVDEILQKSRSPDEQYYEELQVAKKFFDTCLNADLFPMKPSEEYLEVLKNVGGFPAVDPLWNATSFEWINMTAHLSRYGIRSFVDEDFLPLQPFPPTYKVSKFGFAFDVYLENIGNNKSKAYAYNEKNIKDLLRVYGVTDDKAEKIKEEIIEFWRELLLEQEKVLSDGRCWAGRNTSITEKFPKWRQYLSIAWNVTHFRFSRVSDCPCHSYFIKLDELITKKPEVAANFMALDFLFIMHSHLKSKEFQREHCANLLKQAVPLVLSHFYMLEYYNKNAEDEVYEIISELKIKLENIVKTAEWLDEPTKLEALEKLKKLRSHVGQVTDPITDIYIKEMNNLTFTENYAANYLKLAKFKVDLDHYGYLHPDLNENTTFMEILSAVEVNAFYNLMENFINVMAGVLHPPVYHEYFPKSLKYGTIGYIIGHELTHSITNKGSKVDSNLDSRNWWSEESQKRFEEKSKCFIEHYNNFSLPELEYKLNGTKSLSENVADSGGLILAFKTYKSLSESLTKEDDNLPGFNITSDQLFFLSFAQIYCSKYEPRHYWESIAYAHPLDMYRVFGSLQNSDEFSQIYQCPSDAKMNPKDKCKLW